MMEPHLDWCISIVTSENAPLFSPQVAHCVICEALWEEGNAKQLKRKIAKSLNETTNKTKMEFLLYQPLLYSVNHYSRCNFGDQNCLLINIHVDKIGLSSVIGTGHIHTTYLVNTRPLCYNLKLRHNLVVCSFTLGESKEF